jgi:hypothetical protein
MDVKVADQHFFCCDFFPFEKKCSPVNHFGKKKFLVTFYTLLCCNRLCASANFFLFAAKIIFDVCVVIFVKKKSFYRGKTKWHFFSFFRFFSFFPTFPRIFFVWCLHDKPVYHMIVKMMAFHVIYFLCVFTHFWIFIFFIFCSMKKEKKKKNAYVFLFEVVVVLVVVGWWTINILFAFKTFFCEKNKACVTP